MRGNLMDQDFDGVQGESPDDILLVEIAYSGGILADFDTDSDVDGDDFLIWQTGFGTPCGASLLDGDADGDADVDGDDFLIWQSQFGSGSMAGAAAAFPGPGEASRELAIDLLFERPNRSPSTHRLIDVASGKHPIAQPDQVALAARERSPRPEGSRDLYFEARGRELDLGRHSGNGRPGKAADHAFGIGVADEFRLI
jgi:hypothetical protein